MPALGHGDKRGLSGGRKSGALEKACPYSQSHPVPERSTLMSALALPFNIFIFLIDQ